MKLKSSCSVFLFISIIFLTGCKAGAGSYLKDRGNDFIDIIPFSGAIGAGMFASVRATFLAGVGIGYAKADHAGVMLPDSQHDTYDELARFQTWYGEEEVGLGFLWYRTDDWGGGGNFLGVFPMPAGHCTSPHFNFISVADIEVSAHVGIVGLRVGVSPGQLLDFLLGWATLDIAGDDREARRARDMEDAAPDLPVKSRIPSSKPSGPGSRPAGES